MEWLLKSVIRSDVSSVEHNKDDDKIIYKESKVALEEMSQKRWKPALSWTQIYMFTVKKLPCFRAFFFFYPWATCREFMRVFFPQWCRGSAQIRGGDQHVGSYSHAFYCLHIISANNSVRVDELGFAERSGAKRGRRVRVCVSPCARASFRMCMHAWICVTPASVWGHRAATSQRPISSCGLMTVYYV